MTAAGGSALRWGVISAGRISEVFCSAISLTSNDQNVVVAVAARQKSAAQEFADKFKIPKAYGSYHELVADPNVDVVYVGTVNSEHARVCRLALKAGKHVLCEKPMAINAREAREILALAKEQGRFFMEAFWTRFFPAIKKLQKTLGGPSMGEVRILRADFGAVLGHKERVTKREMGGGGLLDIGCYCVQLAELVLGGKPDKVVATGTLEQSGVDDTVSLTLVYPGNKMAMITSSISCKMNNTSHIYGTKGKIELPDLWCPTTVTTPEGTFDFPLPAKLEDSTFYKGEGFVYQIAHVRDRILKGDLESSGMPHSSSLAIMEILDEARRQLGVVFPPDSAIGHAPTARILL